MILFLGMSFHSLGRFDDAIKMYDTALKINPQCLEGYIDKGIELILF